MDFTMEQAASKHRIACGMCPLDRVGDSSKTNIFASREASYPEISQQPYKRGHGYTLHGQVIPGANMLAILVFITDKVSKG